MNRVTLSALIGVAIFYLPHGASAATGDPCPLSVVGLSCGASSDQSVCVLAVCIPAGPSGNCGAGGWDAGSFVFGASADGGGDAAGCFTCGVCMPSGALPNSPQYCPPPITGWEGAQCGDGGVCQDQGTLNEVVTDAGVFDGAAGTALIPLGTCVANAPSDDAGSDGASTLPPDAGASGGAGGSRGGCSCDVGPTGESNVGALLLGTVAMLIAARRRPIRPAARASSATE